MKPALSREVLAELEHTVHRGKADAVAGLVVKAAECLDHSEFAEALSPLLRAKTDAPRSPTVRQLLGTVHYKLGRFDDAARELSAYRRLSGKRDHDPLLADAERGRGHPEKALTILDGLREGEVGAETVVEGMIVAAGALKDLDRADEAVAVLERGPLRPKVVHHHHLRLWYALADSLEAAGRRRDAREWWDMLYTEDPDYFDVSSRRLS